MKTYLEKRPWGQFERFTLNEKSTVKILTINPKQQFSLQYHNHRREFWYFLDNSATLTIGKKNCTAKKGDSFIILPRQLHRIHAHAKKVRVLEISLGSFDEGDIVRIKDAYGRA